MYGSQLSSMCRRRASGWASEAPLNFRARPAGGCLRCGGIPLHAKSWGFMPSGLSKGSSLRGWWRWWRRRCQWWVTTTMVTMIATMRFSFDVFQWFQCFFWIVFFLKICIVYIANSLGAIFIFPHFSLNKTHARHHFQQRLFPTLEQDLLWCQHPVTAFGPWPEALTGLLCGTWRFDLVKAAVDDVEAAVVPPPQTTTTTAIAATTTTTRLVEFGLYLLLRGSLDYYVWFKILGPIQWSWCFLKLLSQGFLDKFDACLGSSLDQCVDMRWYFWRFLDHWCLLNCFSRVPWIFFCFLKVSWINALMIFDFGVWITLPGLPGEITLLARFLWFFVSLCWVFFPGSSVLLWMCTCRCVRILSSLSNVSISLLGASSSFSAWKKVDASFQVSGVRGFSCIADTSIATVLAEYTWWNFECRIRIWEYCWPLHTVVPT